MGSRLVTAARSQIPNEAALIKWTGEAGNPVEAAQQLRVLLNDAVPQRATTTRGSGTSSLSSLACALKPTNHLEESIRRELPL